MSELKPCPFCGSELTSSDEFDDEVLLYGCTKDLDCPMYDARGKWVLKEYPLLKGENECKYF